MSGCSLRLVRSPRQPASPGGALRAVRSADRRRRLVVEAVETEFLQSIGYDAYDVGPLFEGWRYQRDTAAYAGIYAVPGSEYPTWRARQVTREMLQETLGAAVRYGDS